MPRKASRETTSIAGGASSSCLLKRQSLPPRRKTLGRSLDHPRHRVQGLRRPAPSGPSSRTLGTADDRRPPVARADRDGGPLVRKGSARRASTRPPPMPIASNPAIAVSSVEPQSETSPLTGRPGSSRTLDRSRDAAGATWRSCSACFRPASSLVRQDHNILALEAPSRRPSTFPPIGFVLATKPKRSRGDRRPSRPLGDEYSAGPGPRDQALGQQVGDSFGALHAGDESPPSHYPMRGTSCPRGSPPSGSLRRTRRRVPPAFGHRCTSRRS